MNNPERYILKQNSFNRHLVDIFTDEKKAVISKASNRVTDFDAITKLVSINSLNVFVANEDEKNAVYHMKQK